MEQFAVDTISAGGALGVLFVLFLLGFGWCFVKIRDIEKRLDDGDSRFKDFEKSLGVRHRRLEKEVGHGRENP